MKSPMNPDTCRGVAKKRGALRSAVLGRSGGGPLPHGLALTLGLFGLLTSTPAPLGAQPPPAPAARPADADLRYRHDESYQQRLAPPGLFLGAPLGSRFTPHHDVLRYCRHAADGSPLARLVNYGVTPEGRELIALIISSAENLSRLDEVRDLQMRLADPRRLGDGESLADLQERLPAVVWFSYNVHGNEPSPTETALRLIYHLLDDDGPTTRKLLEQTVLILDPLLNPDGRERYLQWFHGVAVPGGDPDPAAREHDEPWPGGRTNHFYFDLNRDWSWQSQPETRARIALYLEWQPLVHVDFHEMSPETSYFFFPAEAPIHAQLPAHTRRWGEIFGRANAAAFDARGWDYYTAESFDLFYPGYGDTWPSFQGAIGMTYEQAGGPGGGLRYQRRNGEILTLRQRLVHHLMASLATLECAADRKAELQASFHEFRAGPSVAPSASPDPAPSDPELGSVAGPAAPRLPLEYVFPTGLDDDATRALVGLLLVQGVEVEQTLADTVAESLVDPDGSERAAVKLPAGSVVVPVRQPAGRLVQALLEPEALVTENRFYDVSAWSLPYAMNAACLQSTGTIAVDRARLTELPPRTVLLPPPGQVGYLLRWQGHSSALALRALQAAGHRVSLIPRAVEAGGRSFPRGSLLVRAGVEPKQTHADVHEIGVRCGVSFTALASGWTEVGIDLGSSQISELRMARIAVVSGPRIASGSFGAIWYLLERELELPFTAIDLEGLQAEQLARFDVLVIPDGFDVASALEGALAKRLESWVSEGGVLVAMGAPAFSLGVDGLGLARASSKARPSASEEVPGADQEPRRRKIEDLRRERREGQVPGNIFRIDLDAAHPLAFGLAQQLVVFHDSTESFTVSGTASDVGAFTDEPAASGYISDENIEKLRRRVYLYAERQGRGHVVLFAGDPNFRLFWRGTTPLFLNALLLLSTY